MFGVFLSFRNDVHTTHCSFRFRRFSFIILCATDLTIWVDGSSYKHAYHYIVMPTKKSRTDCIQRNAQNRPELRKSEQKPMTPRPTSLHANEGSVVNGFFGYVNGYAFVTCLSFQLIKINFHVFFLLNFLFLFYIRCFAPYLVLF